jgi:hypothetical protein
VAHRTAAGRGGQETTHRPGGAHERPAPVKLLAVDPTCPEDEVTAIRSITLECGQCQAQQAWHLGDEYGDSEALRRARLPPGKAACQNCGCPVPIDMDHLLVTLEGEDAPRRASSL